MSHTHPTSTSSKFQLRFDSALKAYTERTKNDLLTHPLAQRLEACDSASDILAVLQGQFQELDESQRNNTKWLDPTVKVLYAFSVTLREGVGLAFSPATVNFIGFSVLFSTAKDVRMDPDTLFGIFKRLDTFFLQLEFYTELALDEELADIFMEIMAEVLNIIGIATKEMKHGRTKKYIKRLFGNRTDIENALKTLDILTKRVVRLARAGLNSLNTDTSSVRAVKDFPFRANKIVAGIGQQIRGIDDVIIDDEIMAVMDDGKEAWEVIQQAADGVDRMERNQLRQDLRRWLSPPDPSTNHSIACNAHHEGTGTWFLEGRTYKEWKSTDSESLLWIHGKPGSGKSTLCSTIIEDVQTMCDVSQASMAYFYFNFRDTNKSHWRDLLPSLLTQLSSLSDLRYDILSRLYTEHDDGAQRPSDRTLKRCLKEMLRVPDQHPTYLIMDALDECHDISGIRNRVLLLVKMLVNLHIPNLHICVTSRPEFDIRDVLEPLTSRRVSLHDRRGQKEDIEEYIRSVVYSNSEQIMRGWRTKDKELVIQMLSERADGMFRWTFCQLEVLRDCLVPSVRRTLMELPESLDETYERILKDIKKPNERLAQCVLQCLVVAVRPLRVEELAEVLAVEFDDAKGIPRLKPDWRWEEQEPAILLACSNLIAIVQAGDSRVVQISHFSVKEFLTSPRLATASGEVSNYHIDLGPAHTILAQACLCALLQTQDNVDMRRRNDHQLAQYAAEHWTTHAQFGDVSRLQKGMEYLFDADKPHFMEWVTLYDIDTKPGSGATLRLFAAYFKSPAGPLYYAALCGFRNLVEHLITKHPHDVNADGGYYVRPLVAALAGEHFQTADLLHRNGADPDVWGDYGRNPLHASASSGNSDVVRILLKYGPANINARDVEGWTPLLWASGHNFKDSSVIRLLLEHGADIQVQNRVGRTPLHRASFNGSLEVVRLLLEYGADVEAKNIVGETALQEAVGRGRHEVVKLLREHGAKY